MHTKCLILTMTCKSLNFVLVLRKVHLETAGSRQSTWTENIAKDVDCCDDPYSSGEHAATEDVPGHIGIHSGKKITDKIVVMRAAKHVLSMRRDHSSPLMQELLRFPQTSILTASDCKEHLFKFWASWKLYDTGVQYELISLETKLLSVFWDTGNG